MNSFSGFTLPTLHGGALRGMHLVSGRWQVGRRAGCPSPGGGGGRGCLHRSGSLRRVSPSRPSWVPGSPLRDLVVPMGLCRLRGARSGAALPARTHVVRRVREFARSLRSPGAELFPSDSVSTSCLHPGAQPVRGVGVAGAAGGGTSVWEGDTCRLPLTHRRLGTKPATQERALAENCTGDLPVCRTTPDPWATPVRALLNFFLG